jgi:hypothetical protein
MTISANNRYIHGSSGLGGVAKYFGLLSTRTLAQRVSDIGSTVATLEVYNSETISTSLEVPSTLTVVMKPGAELTVTAGILNFEGAVYCEGQSPHFNVSAGAEVIFNGVFQAGPVQVFEGAGTVSFGRDKTELVSYTDDTGWTLGTDWSYAASKFHHTAGAASSLSHAATIVSGNFYELRFTMSGSTTTYGARPKLAGHTDFYFGGDGAFRNIYKATSTAALEFQSQAAYDGYLSDISVRLLRQSKVDIFYPQWWGGTPDGVTNNATYIQKAIDAAYYAGASVAYLSPGYWGISSRVSLVPGQVKLVGAGPSTHLYALAAFPATKATGYGMMGFRCSYQGQTPITVLENITLDSSGNSNAISQIWFNKNVQAVGFEKIWFYGFQYADQVGIDCPYYYCNEEGTDLGQATHHSCYGKDWSFSYLMDTNGRGCIHVEPNDGTQRWVVDNATFSAYYTALNFGGLNSEFRSIYFNTPFTSSDYTLLANGTGGIYPRVRFTNSGGLSMLKDPYFEDGTDVYVIWDYATNARTSNTVWNIDGANHVILNTTQFLTFCRQAATAGITRTDARTLTIDTTVQAGGINLGVSGLGWYLNDGAAVRNTPDNKPYVWVEDDATPPNLKKYSFTYPITWDGTNSIITVDADLPSTVTAVYRQNNGSVHLKSDYYAYNSTGYTVANRLMVGQDYYSNEYMKCLRSFNFRPYTTSHTISNGASEALGVTQALTYSFGTGMPAAILVTPPRGTAAGLICTGMIDSAGDIITVNVTNLTGSPVDINGMYFEIVVMGF